VVRVHSRLSARRRDHVYIRIVAHIIQVSRSDLQHESIDGRTILQTMAIGIARPEPRSISWAQDFIS
jgi:hypothetical protein